MWYFFKNAMTDDNSFLTVLSFHGGVDRQIIQYYLWLVNLRRRRVGGPGAG
jgi:hypothetical protein